MNPLKSIMGTIILGFILAVVAVFALGINQQPNPWALWVWLHVIIGIVWVGLLYYFNFVQVPGVGKALADKEPGPAAINKYIAPTALLWFRWAALGTWLTGMLALEAMHFPEGSGVVAAFTFSKGYATIGLGAWLGTIMMLNVWGLIWRNQKKILGMVEATDEEIVKAKFVALMASRVNVVLSIPMLLAMTGQGHGSIF